MPASRAHFPEATMGSSAGFTLIELMIVVVIIGVLATVATIAYTGHLRETRILDGQHVLNKIKIQQEVYFQRHNQYVNARFHPAVHTDYAAKPWAPVPADWAALSVSVPGDGSTYFSFMTRGYLAGSGDAISTSLKLDTSVPTFYAMAQGDMDGKAATQPMQMVLGSQSGNIVTYNKGH